jgi:DNA-binding NarL/FixJ family response regulator
MEQAKKIAIAIVDDHTLFRKGVAGLLAEFEELNLLFEAENGMQLQTQLASGRYSPQVILMDIHMPVMDGYATCAWVKSEYPEIKVLALSMFEEEDAVIKMLKCGACGYVLKESDPRELLEAIRSVERQGICLNEMVTGKMIRSLVNPEKGLLLSVREVEFMKWCCSELTYKEIADRMCVSPRTVDNYRESLFEKLSLKSRTGIVLFAIKNKYFNP